MRYALLPLALSATLAFAGSAQASTTVSAQSIQRAQALGFNTVATSADGRLDGLFGHSDLVAANSDAVAALFNGELGNLVGLRAGSNVRIDDVNFTDEGHRYYKTTQLHHGVPVWGDQLSVETTAAGNVLSVSGSGIGIDLQPIDMAATIKGDAAIRQAALAALQRDGVATGSRPQFSISGTPELYVYAAAGSTPTLAYSAIVSTLGTGGAFSARVFADANTGALLNAYTLNHSALNRSIHDLNSGCVGTQYQNLPGPVSRQEGGAATGILPVDRIYADAGRFYWYFKNAFNRDSYNNAGALLRVTARAEVLNNSGQCSGAGENAFWSSQLGQMVIGEGGTQLNDLSVAPDVMFHEIGHAITSNTSNLAYQKESGGLNEATSDIYAAAVEAWVNTVQGDPTSATAIAYQPDADTWKVGEGLYKANGNPLRWMDDPAKDGRSLDRYSQYTQQFGNCSPTGNNDYCGVHTTSGIANLAFYLLTTGGTHPRNATTINVTKIPFDRAIKYLYEAHVNIVQSNDTFSRFRNAMMTRARANGSVGACDEVRIGEAWDAVGVTGTAPANPNACGGATNVAPVANFTSTSNGLTATFTDTSTDSDGTIASRAWDFGDGGTSTTANPSRSYAAAGTYTVKLTVTDNGGLTHTKTQSVTVTTTPSGTTVLTNGVTVTGQSAAKDAELTYTLVVPAGATNLKFEATGGTGDADLYVKFGSAPTIDSYDCRPFQNGSVETCTIASAQAGTYYVKLRGYAAFSGVSLKGSFTPAATGGGVFSNTTNYNIPDGGTVSSPITVSGQSGNATTTTKVSVKVVHPYRGDLKIELVGSNGQTRLLKAASGTDSADNVTATYTVDASSMSRNGTWQLKVTDVYAGDVGYIDEWSIQF